MDSTELAALQRRARVRYEGARLLRCVLGFAPVFVLVAGSVALGRRPSSALFFGGALYLAGVALLWTGRGLHRGVLPGVVAGTIPLVAALVSSLGHGCASGHCSTLCVPACTVGGVAAGALVSWIIARRNLGGLAWLGAGATAMLTGAMGCSCVGYSGVIGLAAGFAVGTLPLVGRRLVRG